MRGKKIIVVIASIMILGILAMSVIYVLPLLKERDERLNELERVEAIKSEKRILNNELTAEVNALKSSPEAVEKVAREKFTFIKEGETVMKYKPEQAPQN